jgi:NAD(P)H-dependent FMN reductase
MSNVFFNMIFQLVCLNLKMAKKKILGISGSAALHSSNLELLKTLSRLFEMEYSWTITNALRNFPLFTPEQLSQELPSVVGEFKKQVLQADAIVISTPEYTHNIPAILKNAIEWCTASGEFSGKPILPITFTPHEPRGKFAMHSLIESLKTLDAKIIAEIPLYKTDVTFREAEIDLASDIEVMLSEALKLC